MPGQGRTFRRQIADFWQIWPMPPKIETPRDVVFIDGIYLAKKACILICFDGEYVLGWYLCRSEQSRSWQALMQRIATLVVVVSDGRPGLRKALKKFGVLPNFNGVLSMLYGKCIAILLDALRR